MNKHTLMDIMVKACADKYTVKFAERRGFKLYDEESLNTKLLDNKEKPNGKQDSQI